MPNLVTHSVSVPRAPKICERLGPRFGMGRGWPSSSTTVPSQSPLFKQFDHLPEYCGATMRFFAIHFFCMGLREMETILNGDI